jgi:hypothetical protein
MNEISIQDSELVGGAGFWGWVAGQVAGPVIGWTASQIMQGNVDYAGMVEQQGTYYNMMGA